MDFRTELTIEKKVNFINHNDKIMFLGSCFSNNIGNKFIDNKLDVLINPFGVLYNPVSICNSLDILIKNREFTKKDLFFNNNFYSSFYHHSSFSNEKEKKCLDKINQSNKIATDFLQNTDYIFITLGTSFVYEEIENGIVVSNCHKIKSEKFKRFILSPEKIENCFKSTIKKLLKFNSKIKIVFTISPIRHLKDGFEQNNLSKSILKVGINNLVINNNYISYFPSYEIVMDDLRDYRFYEKDMTHPNQIAIDYIWEKFSAKYFSEETIKLFNNISKIRASANHRPFNIKSEAHIKFQNKIVSQIKELHKSHPEINFTKELEKLGNN